jgi:phage FluMu protein Com
MDRAEELLERMAVALEALAQDPVIHVETLPPVCPHCETMNPLVRVEESAAQGKLAEFVIQAHCTHCNKVFYAMPVQWEAAKTTDEASMIIAEREEIRGFTNNSGANQRASAGADAPRPSGL